MRWVCCIYTAHIMPVSLWCTHTVGLMGNRVLYTSIGVKFEVARFDISGQFSGALGSEASDEWASRFYLYAL